MDVIIAIEHLADVLVRDILVRCCVIAHVLGKSFIAKRINSEYVMRIYQKEQKR